MAKGGKVQHWKHGWIPLTAWAKAFAHGDTEHRPTANRTAPPGGLKAQRESARRARYLAHVNATADKRAAMEERYNAAHNRKLHRPTNPDSLGEQIKPDPTEMLAEARGGGRPYSAAHMTPDGRFTPERERLHRKIIEDHLRGIKPSGKQPVQYMNGGGPGSGKSSLRTGDNGKMTGYPPTREADDLTGKLDTSQPAGAVLIDPDAIKMMLPEVKQARAQNDSTWAAKAHEESSYLAKRIHAAALDRGLDLVYDGTGDGGEASVNKKVALARDRGYRVEGNYIYLEPDTGVERANKRAERTGRVVAESTIRETYKDVSTTFQKVADTGSMDVLRLFDNNHKPATLLAEFRKGQEPKIVDRAAYRKFLANGE